MKRINYVREKRSPLFLIAIPKLFTVYCSLFTIYSPARLWKLSIWRVSGLTFGSFRNISSNRFPEWTVQSLQDGTNGLAKREEGGLSIIVEKGTVFEKGGVNFSDVTGRRLPPSATAKRPELSGAGFGAVGVSVVLHPLNPYVPTTHMNVRFHKRHPIGRTSGLVVWGRF